MMIPSGRIEIREMKSNRINRIILLTIIGFLLITLPISAQEEKTRKFEYLPLYKYKTEPETALKLLKDNLAQLGILEDRIVVTILPLEPDKLAVQGEASVIEIAKTLMRNIDPPPPAPPQPPAKPQDLIMSFYVKHMHPKELWRKIDEIMHNFLDFQRFDAGADNMVVYARGDGVQNQINLFIPDFVKAEKDFLNPKQGYSGYRVFVHATQNEKPFIDTLMDFVTTIDKAPGEMRYEIIPVYYVEIKEMIKELQAAGYNAVDTGNAVDANILQLIKSGASPVIYSAPKISSESTSISTQFSGGTGGQIRGNQFQVLAYANPTSTADIFNLVVYGTRQEIQAIRDFIALVDIPAKQILIEAQIIEINIDDLHDLGLREIRGYDDLIQGTVFPKFPGEGTTPQEETANIFTYDDSGASRGSFEASIAALILEGKATIKARPKVTTVDGRQAIISIVRQVPVAQETISPNSDRSTFDISFVPVGITLNIKPRIGRSNSEIQMQVNAVVSNVETINNVVSGLNIQAPELNTREVSTIVRIPNHQSLILGGLISTQTERRTYKVPILGDLPLLGKLFSRTRSSKDRTEIIIVLTPHIANEVGGRTSEEANKYQLNSEFLKPKDSPILDSLDNMVSRSSYIVKFADIEGIDPITKQPMSFTGEKPLVGSANDPVFLTVRNIVNQLNLVDSLNLMDSIVFPSDYPYPHNDDERRIFAEAFIIDYVIGVNDINLDNLTVGKTLLVPSTAFGRNEELNGEEIKWQGENIYSISYQDPLFRRIHDSVRIHYYHLKVNEKEKTSSTQETASQPVSEEEKQPEKKSDEEVGKE